MTAEVQTTAEQLQQLQQQLMHQQAELGATRADVQVRWCCALLCCAVLCCAVLCCAVLCCAVLVTASACICALRQLCGHCLRTKGVAGSKKQL